MHNGKRWRILIIDEDPLILKSLISLLNADGYTATGVSAVSRAMKLLERESFDIVLTELVMEEMDGEELLASIFQKSPDINVIVLSGYRSLEMAVQAMHHGAYDYILKPCDYNLLKSRLDRAITAIRAVEGKKKAQEALRSSQERYRIMMENVHDLLLLFDMERNCLYASPSWESQMGISLSKLVGKNWVDLLCFKDKQSIDNLFQDLHNKKTPSKNIEISIYGQNGEKRIFKGYMLSPQKNASHDQLIFLLLHDITEHLKIQDQEREIERIKAAKDLAIATAHYVNQPMTCIRGLTEIMLKDPKDRDVTLRYLNQILMECDRVEDIIKNLLKINKYETISYVDEEMLRLL